MDTLQFEFVGLGIYMDFLYGHYELMTMHFVSIGNYWDNDRGSTDTWQFDFIDLGKI